MTKCPTVDTQKPAVDPHTHGAGPERVGLLRSALRLRLRRPEPDHVEGVEEGERLQKAGQPERMTDHPLPHDRHAHVQGAGGVRTWPSGRSERPKLFPHSFFLLTCSPGRE